jgi:hypothetical protein
LLHVLLREPKVRALMTLLRVSRPPERKTPENNGVIFVTHLAARTENESPHDPLEGLRLS